ncbi:tail completion or Neck1 protein [Vibrio phage Athena]|uniref:Tail completion protein n=2 Tax=Thalassavirus TaxID=2948922 RepID=A0A6M4EWL7_9CAUD|nr:tail completion or Neck1 protein [Vibrio phage Bennett]YP_010108651.1 tail completion or Neck1 protein [Vibrio phage Athena]QIG66337.1 hypothetical protein CHAZLY21_24 [Vibrio phage Chazly21]QKE60887.1 hypothetical protein DAX_26 [Vibrio phage Dax]QKN85467.1 hypothetical protein DIREPILLOW8_28 [Vibrio phage Direpillow8]WBU76833.1 hypothetical protein KRONOS_27 [Vibrio phage Kronos]QJQ85060.1 hypothetical protein BENNETT_24 [Vibrio phage Bennett]
MAISQMLENIIRRELDDRSSKGTKRQVKYDVQTDDTREESNVATISFKFSKPLAQAEASDRGKNVLAGVAKNLNTHQLGIVDAILAQYGLTKSVGRKRARGTVNVRLGDYLEEGRSLGVNTVKGKMISQTNLRSLLEILAKDYLIRDMKKANAPLKYRTGRFANSLDVRSVRIQDTDTGRKPELSIFYNYMTYPYATFDPKKSTRPAMYNRPSYGARNPQVLIGDALAKAARDIIHSRYRIDIREALQ